VFKQVVSTAKAPSSFLTLEKLSMKKTLIALAVLAASGASFAQSTVTLSGQFGTSLQSADWYTTSKVGRTDGNLNVTVTEDLGGGLKFTGVAGVDLQNRGAAVNGRNSSVRLDGSFGTVSYGTSLANLNLRTGAVSGLSLDKGLQFVTNGEAVVSALAYVSPELAPGFKVGVNSVQAGTDNNQNGMKDALVLEASYAVGPLAAVIDTRNSDNRTRATVTYDLGVAKAAVGYISAYTPSTGALKAQFDMDVAIPMGAVTLAAQYVKRGSDNGYALGASYALSKRTALNLAYANIDTASSAGSAYNGGQTRLRLNHTF